MQFDFLVSRGLNPNHKLLDVGCGSLRGGIHFIRYLDSGNYYGVDKEKWLLDAGFEEVKRAGMENKKFTLVQMSDFNFQRFGVKFDYALAFSLFTYLLLNSIIRCLINIKKVLKEDGKFYVTFFESKEKFELNPIKQSEEITTYFDRDPYHYNFRMFEIVSEEIGLKVKYIGDFGHPRNQKMMVFTIDR